MVITCSRYYDNALGRQKLSVPLLAGGLQRGDTCFLIATPEVQSELIQHLIDIGLDVKDAINRGQLLITEGMTNSTEMLSYLRKQFILATRSGNLLCA